MKRIKKKQPRPVTHEQWIEINRKDGVTICTFYPPNDEFERQRLEMDPPPTLIYRRLNFVHGVPDEYDWTEPLEDQRVWGGLFLQRLTNEDWLTVYEIERADGNTRVHAWARCQARPAAYGPCACHLCQRRAGRDAST